MYGRCRLEGNIQYSTTPDVDTYPRPHTCTMLGVVLNSQLSVLQYGNIVTPAGAKAARAGDSVTSLLPMQLSNSAN